MRDARRALRAEDGECVAGPPCGRALHRIADGLLARAKRLAAQRRTTLKTVIEDALREALRAEAGVRAPQELSTHTFRGKGLRPGLSWDDWSALHDLAYEGRGA